MSPGRLRALAEAILRRRNTSTSRGEAASYRLTARAAELVAVAELLAAGNEGRDEFVAWLVQEGATALLDQPSEGKS
ncbi:hypothetical protein HG15A2_03310 [Adhaeretor mobilis]|uniref:Uncharacterized protein n=2 Tax=Adhaeretor mobilis TaxID=1930276 RepID=A0A517MQC8_9BACT|nr:hypothetical protein HG15A2_03310 [Adhaeretor mobilis]